MGTHIRENLFLEELAEKEAKEVSIRKLGTYYEVKSGNSILIVPQINIEDFIYSLWKHKISISKWRD